MLARLGLCGHARPGDARAAIQFLHIGGGHVVDRQPSVGHRDLPPVQPGARHPAHTIITPPNARASGTAAFFNSGATPYTGVLPIETSRLPTRSMGSRGTAVFFTSANTGSNSIAPGRSLTVSFSGPNSFVPNGLPNWIPTPAMQGNGTVVVGYLAAFISWRNQILGFQTWFQPRSA